MRRATRDEDERAYRRVEDVIAELDPVHPLERVDQLVLARVDMQGRPLPRGGGPLDRGDGAAAGVRHGLERRHGPGGVGDGKPLAGAEGERLDERSSHRGRRQS